MSKDHVNNERKPQDGLAQGDLKEMASTAVPHDHLPVMQFTGVPGRLITAGWLGKAPDIADSDIEQTFESDVVIVGAGVAGLSAARAASEAGASVIVIEKATTFQCRSGQYGCVNSKIHKSLGMKFDHQAAILETMKQMGYRADQRMWQYWADHSGEAFDWLLELAPDVDVIPNTALTYDRNKITLCPLHFPEPPGYNPAMENSPSYPTVLAFFPDQKQMQKRVYQRCLDRGCKFLFSTWGRKLIRPNNQGRVQGIICRDINGVYAKILAKKGVILTCGDFSSNKAMMADLVPWAANLPSMFPDSDARGVPANMGDGHKMGIWAGAKMEDGPYAPVIHAIGGPLGIDAFFLANTNGKRFVNEDIGGQQLSASLYRQPGNFAWQIFDDKWPDQIGLMQYMHGTVNYCVAADKNPKHEDAFISIGKSVFTSREDLQATEGIVIAGSLDDLAGKLGLNTKAQAALLQSIKRYNDLCGKGVDEDFGKTQKRLFPIANPPFYAARMVAGAMLVCMGGLTCDPETGNVLDGDYRGIDGLYVAGNNSGGRFLGDYPVVTAGVSLAFALTYGRLVGMTVAGF